jgi:hypothetical protein
MRDRAMLLEERYTLFAQRAKPIIAVISHQSFLPLVLFHQSICDFYILQELLNGAALLKNSSSVVAAFFKFQCVCISCPAEARPSAASRASPVDCVSMFR